ncbi:uncharacterized protein ACO6RY_14131 [Pungitius sinensis]
MPPGTMVSSQIQVTPRRTILLARHGSVQSSGVQSGPSATKASFTDRHRYCTDCPTGVTHSEGAVSTGWLQTDTSTARGSSREQKCYVAPILQRIVVKLTCRGVWPGDGVSVTMTFPFQEPAFVTC